MTKYICNGCGRQLKFNNNPAKNTNTCRLPVNVNKQGEGIVEAECGMKYERIVINEATTTQGLIRSNRSLAKKAG